MRWTALECSGVYIDDLIFDVNVAAVGGWRVIKLHEFGRFCLHLLDDFLVQVFYRLNSFTGLAVEQQQAAVPLVPALNLALLAVAEKMTMLAQNRFAKAFIPGYAASNLVVYSDDVPVVPFDSDYQVVAVALAHVQTV